MLGCYPIELDASELLFLMMWWELILGGSPIESDASELVFPDNGGGMGETCRQCPQILKVLEKASCS